MGALESILALIAAGALYWERKRRLRPAPPSAQPSQTAPAASTPSLAPASFEVTPAQASPASVDGRAIVRRAAVLYGVDPDLAEAHARVESSLDPRAVNPSDPSFGLMQILCTNDGPNSVCRNRLPAIPEFASMTPNKLMDPDTNARIGVQIIQANLQQFGDRDTAIIAYNHYSGALSRSRGQGTPKAGLDYLAKVKRALREIESGN